MENFPKGLNNERCRMIREVIKGIQIAKQLRDKVYNQDHEHEALDYSLLTKMFSCFDSTFLLAKSLGIELPYYPEEEEEEEEPFIPNPTNNDGFRAPIIRELTKGRQVAKQLRSLVASATEQTSSGNVQALQLSLVDNILSSLEKSASIARLREIPEPSFSTTENSRTPFEMQSAHSLDLTRRVSGSSSELGMSQKTKTLSPWWNKTFSVRLRQTGSAIPDDGFSWRKYGEKVVLGLKFTRSYYRCVHRHTLNCSALKQVQPSDEDPSILTVQYRGEHRCRSIESTHAQTMPLTAPFMPPSPDQ